MVCLYWPASSEAARVPRSYDLRDPQRACIWLDGARRSASAQNRFCRNSTASRQCGAERRCDGGNPMYAVIRAGGKQYRVAPGDIVKIEKVSESGQNIEFEVL